MLNEIIYWAKELLTFFSRFITLKVIDMSNSFFYLYSSDHDWRATGSHEFEYLCTHNSEKVSSDQYFLLSQLSRHLFNSIIDRISGQINYDLSSRACVKIFFVLDRSNGTLSKDVSRKFLYDTNFRMNFNRIEQFETLFKSDLIDLKKLKVLAFSGMSKIKWK